MLLKGIIRGYEADGFGICGVFFYFLCVLLDSVCELLVSGCVLLGSVCELFISVCVLLGSVCELFISVCVLLDSVCELLISACVLLDSVCELLISACVLLDSVCELLISWCVAAVTSCMSSTTDGYGRAFHAPRRIRGAFSGIRISLISAKVSGERGEVLSFVKRKR